LLERVVRHKEVFFRSSWARYEEAKPGTLRICPAAAHVPVLQSDYEKMREMFFKDPPAWSVILESLEFLEAQINKAHA